MIGPGSVLPAAPGERGLRLVTGVRRLGGDTVPLVAISAVELRRHDAGHAPTAAARPRPEAPGRAGPPAERPRPSAALLDLPALAEAQRPEASDGDRGAADGVVTDPTRLTPEEERAVAALRRRDAAVSQEEATHAAQAGRFAGAPIFETVVGPDGKRYRIGGEAPVRAKLAGTDPGEARRAAAILALAATAPNAPSAGDLAAFRRAAGQATHAEGVRPGRKLDVTG